MARDGDKSSKRAFEDLRRGLARSDAELACAGLLAFEPPARQAHLPRVARLVAAEVGRWRARRDWSRLVPWAKRVEAEPRLAAALGQADAGELRWALVWACAFTGEWARAERFWGELVSSADPTMPVIDAVSAWIAARGSPAPVPPRIEQLAPPEPDARMGVERVAPRPPAVEPVRPACVSEAERATTVARALLGFEAFEAWVIRGLDQVDPAVTRATAEVACALALREALLRLGRTERPDGGTREVLAPLTLVAECASRGLAAAPHGLLGLRMILRALHDPAGGRPRGAVLVALVRACLADAALAPSVENALGQVAIERALRPEAAEVLLEAVGAAADHAPSAGLWAAGAVLASRKRHKREHARPAEPPRWLELRAGAMIGDGRGLVRWLGEHEERLVAQVLSFLARRVPADTAARALAAAATLENERLRAAVARSLDELLCRMSPRFCESCDFEHDADEADWDKLSPAAQKVWAAVEDDVLALSPDCLDRALARAPDAAGRSAVLERYAERARSAREWVQAVEVARAWRLRKAPRALIHRLVSRYASDPSELASGFDEALGRIAPADLTVLAGALLACVDANVGTLPPHVPAAAERARRLLDRVERGRASGRRPAVQSEELPFDNGGGAHAGE